MKNIKAVQVIGSKDSGKTHLILELCEFFRSKGLKIGCIKYSHHSLDKADSDTDKMSQVADVVAGISQENSLLFFGKRKGFFEIRSFFDVDLLMVEGGKHEIDFLPQILVVDKGEEQPVFNEDLLIGVYLRQGATFDSIKDIIVSYDAIEIAEVILDKGFYLPGLNCGACKKQSCREMGVDILKGKATNRDCVVMADESVTVEIDGKLLELNPFVKNIVKSTIIGMLSSLKGYCEGDIKINIKSKQR